MVKKIGRMVNVVSVRQDVQMGLGHAVLCASSAVENEPFAVLLGDEVMVGEPNVTRHLAASYTENGLSSVFLMEVPKEDVRKYGIVAVQKQKENLYKISDVIEKPTQDKAPSQFALPGRYVFSPKIFKFLQETKPGKNGEIQLTDAMTKIAQTDGLLGLTIAARRYDTGDKLGFLQANIELGLEHPETKDELKKYILKLSKRLL
jgi:UTP--glucose-1-phosphate uridylyltransferase